jgi:flavin reductase (DIM6/NTAB) family NADH-FMN oxidoreductase RutF
VSGAGETFSELLGDLDYPMFIVTVAANGERAGCLIGFATQGSIDPPSFLALISKRNRTYRVASEADALAVHLAPDDEPELVELFGSQTGDEIDKFERCAWTEGPRGLPILDACPSWFACEVRERLDCGDHVAHLLEPFEARRGHGDEAFPFHRAKRMEPGKEA